MTWKLTQTTITESNVHMRLEWAAAGQATAIVAGELGLAGWIDFQVPLNELRSPWDQDNKLGDPETRHVGEVRLAALRALRDAIGEEIRRLSSLPSLR